jgi:hypothetical protein
LTFRIWQSETPKESLIFPISEKNKIKSYPLNDHLKKKEKKPLNDMCIQTNQNIQPMVNQQSWDTQQG